MLNISGTIARSVILCWLKIVHWQARCHQHVAPPVPWRHLTCLLPLPYHDGRWTSAIRRYQHIIKLVVMRHFITATRRAGGCLSKNDAAQRIIYVNVLVPEVEEWWESVNLLRKGSLGIGVESQFAPCLVHEQQILSCCSCTTPACPPAAVLPTTMASFRSKEQAHTNDCPLWVF